MEYQLFTDDFDLKVAILGVNLHQEQMRKAYIDKGLTPAGMVDAEKKVIAYKIPTVITGSGRKTKKKPLSVDQQREFFQELLPTLDDLGVTHIVVTEPKNYQTLSGMSKAAHEAGTLRDVSEDHFPEYFGKMKVAYAPNHKMMFFDPEKTTKNIQLAMDSVVLDMSGEYEKPGQGIIKTAIYPKTYREIRDALLTLHHMQCPYTSDIEAFSLDMHDAGIGTVSFAWNKHEGMAFQVDPAPGIFNYPVRKLLAEFFYHNKEKHYWHNAGYDVAVLIYQLVHNNPLCDISKYELFDEMTNVERMNCTKIISYLATNSCAGNKLGLKDQAVEFAGNYAVEDIKDITKIPVHELLEYNLVDALSTWFVIEKNYPKMVADEQEDIYNDIFIPSLVDVLDMQINGMPVDMEQVAIAKKELTDFQQKAVDVMLANPITKAYTQHMKAEYVEKMHAKWKKKRITVDDVELELNPGSAQQLQGLLFSPHFMALPVVGKTDTGAPSTKGKHLQQMKNFTDDADILAFLDALIDYKDSAILISTFIPALEGARKAPDGNYYMHGNFNLGGTVSGRLSSSDPNLQNLPSKSRLAKFIKRCIRAPKGWIFCGLDFDSLEDKISALLTKDPNKIKVYTDGYDGHSLRAYSYFGHKMLDIDPNSVDSINSIAKLYPKERQDSKAPTFLLTYGGTYHGLKGNCGFSEEVALSIEANYHDLYKVSDDYVALKIQGASDNGYLTVAFGLRVRTPVLEQTILGNRKTPNAAKAESRTAGNAIGQSWGLLNNRAATEFMRKVRKDKYRRDNIRICCQIHDAQYYLVRDDSEMMKWFNDNIVEAVNWQDHPDIEHDKVKLSGKTEIFYPTWAENHQIPNGASEEEIKEICSGILKQAA